MKSFKPKEGSPPDSPLSPMGGRNAEVDFHGQHLSNDTHQSTTDPEARLYRKGRGRRAKLSFMGGASQGPRPAKQAGWHAEGTPSWRTATG